jgi:hypothetical protein
LIVARVSTGLDIGGRKSKGGWVGEARDLRLPLCRSVYSKELAGKVESLPGK